MTHKLFRFAAVALAATAVLLPSAAAQSGTPLISATSTPAASGAVVNPAASQSRLVAIDTQQLQSMLGGAMSSAPFTLQLFPNTQVQLQSVGTESAYGGGLVWHGTVVGHANSSVVVSLMADAVAASIRFDDHLYSIVSAGNGVHWVAQIDESAMPVCGNTHAHTVTSPPTATTAVPQSAGSFGSTRASGNPDIDVMVVYTTSAKNGAGGLNGIQAKINLAVAETNTGYSTSLVDQRLVLVHTEEMVGYNEPASMSTMLSDLRGTNDGKMDQVHALRNQHGADTVTLINQNGGYCGIAYLMGNVSAGFASNAFSVTKSSCATGYYSFGHELGHNMGSTHDPGNGSGAAYFYGYGYRTPNSQYRTVMAYSPGTRVDRYSSPLISYAGFVMGATSQDNSRSMNNTASTVAAWRTPPVVTPIMATPVLVSGFPGQLNVSNCTAAGTVFFAYSLSGAGPTSTAYGNAALSAPFVTLTSVTALGDGTASLTVPVPASAGGVNIWLQALDLSSGDLSNGVSTTVI